MKIELCYVCDGIRFNDSYCCKYVMRMEESE